MNWIEQHVRNLAKTSGFEEADAKRLFVRKLHVSIDVELRSNRTYRLAFIYAVNLLSRIFPSLTFDELPASKLPILPWTGNKPLGALENPELTVHFGKGSAHEAFVTANCHRWHVLIDSPHSPTAEEEWNPVLALLTACYATGRACKLLLGDALAGRGLYEPFSILDFDRGEVEFDWSRDSDIGHVTSAGIGAIGSAFLFALASHGMASGRLSLVDHDLLDRPNLCRYSFFTEEEIGTMKVLSAKRRLDSQGMQLEVKQFGQRFETYFDENYHRDPRFRVEQLISAPDRRDTRRRFQAKLPRRLWDASTGPNQVVLHHNDYDPRLACLTCIYPETPDENAHLRHVADALNLPLERILSGASITTADASAILGKYPQLAVEDVIGKEFDSVFRQLCSASEIRTGANRSVLAPLSFVSAIAGVLLYFEFVKSLNPEVFGSFQLYNYSYLDPLTNPNPSFRRLKNRSSDCVCADPRYRKVFADIWHQ
jgi:hypothetical protein